MAGLVSTGGESTGSFDFVVGVVNGEQILVNPTLAELNDYGVKWKKDEPNYEGKDSDGNVQHIVDIYFKVTPFKYKEKAVEAGKEIRNIRFYIGTKPKLSQSGKQQFVNAFGKFAYAEDLAGMDAYSWFNKEGIREALPGEENLYGWLREYGNFKNSDQLQLNVELLKKGDFSEMIDFIKDTPDRKFKCLLGLSYNEDKDRYNSVVYTRKFFRSWATNMSRPDGNGGFDNISFEEGIPELLNKDYMDFSKSVCHPGDARILSLDEVKALADTPDADVPDGPQQGSEENPF